MAVGVGRLIWRLARVLFESDVSSSMELVGQISKMVGKVVSQKKYLCIKGHW